jgi:hypothetical protein
MLSGASTGRFGYSPMLAQMNPIIRKKPEKSAISPTEP